MLLLAAFQTLLYRYSGQGQIVVGSPIANRTQAGNRGPDRLLREYPGAARGPFGSPGFGELVGRVRGAALGAFTHQDVPFERWWRSCAGATWPLSAVPGGVRAADRRRSERPGGGPVGAGADLTPLGVAMGVAKFDLSLNLGEWEGFSGSIEYNTDLFDGATIERLLGHFETLLAGALADPQAHVWEIPLLGGAEREQLLAWSGAGESYPLAGSLHSRFEGWAAARPAAVAAVFGDESRGMENSTGGPTAWRTGCWRRGWRRARGCAWRWSAGWAWWPGSWAS